MKYILVSKQQKYPFPTNINPKRFLRVFSCQTPRSCLSLQEGVKFHPKDPSSSRYSFILKSRYLYTVQSGIIRDFTINFVGIMLCAQHPSNAMIFMHDLIHH